MFCVWHTSIFLHVLIVVSIYEIIKKNLNSSELNCIDLSPTALQIL